VAFRGHPADVFKASAHGQCAHLESSGHAFMLRHDPLMLREVDRTVLGLQSVAALPPFGCLLLHTQLRRMLRLATVARSNICDVTHKKGVLSSMRSSQRPRSCRA